MLISASDIIKNSVDLYRNNFKLFLSYALLMLIPSLVISIGGLTLPLLLGASSSLALGFVLFFVLAVVAALFSIWAGMAFIKVVVQRYHTVAQESMKSNLGNTVHLILPSIWISILTGLAVMGGFILLIIPGIIFAIWFAFGLYALVLDNKRGTEALKYSKSLVSGRWFGVLWRIIAPALVFVIILGIAQWIIGIPFGLTTMSEDSLTLSGLVYVLLSQILSILITPLTTTAPTILYEELKKNPIGVPVPKTSETPEVPVA